MAAQPTPLMASISADSGRILDSLSTSVLIVDRDRQLLYLNVSAETLLASNVAGLARWRPVPADSGTSITELDVLAFDNAEGSENPIGEGEHGPEVRVRLGNLSGVVGPVKDR